MRRPLGLIFPILGLAIAALALAVAFASAAAAASGTTVSVEPFYAVLAPYLQALADAVIFALIGWVATIVQRWTGIQIEARHREALHSAAMTGVTKAIARVGGSVNGMSLDVRSDVVASAIEWIEASVPDAIAALGVTPEKVAALATAKLGQLIASAPAPSATDQAA